MSIIKNRRLCLNCESSLDTVSLYCPQCGQKNKPPNFSTWELVKEFFNSFFNLDAKIYQTVFGLFVPGKLTKAYMAGQRSSYFNPVRILLVTMLLYFGLLAREVNESIPSTSKSEIRQMTSVVLDDTKLKIDSLKSFYFNASDYEAIDCLHEDVFGHPEDDRYFMPQMNIADLDFSELKIKQKDIYELSADEIIKNYKIEGRWKQLQVKQTIRVYKNRNGIPAFLIGNLIWAIAVVLLFAALVLKLLFIRRGYYYAEHLVFLIHVHGFAFFISALMLIVKWIWDNAQDQNSPLIDTSNGFKFDTGLNAGVVFIIVTLFFILAQKMYYGQGWFKTITKFLILTISYSLILIIVAFAISLLSLVFF